jgi:aminomethyltransferase
LTRRDPLRFRSGDKVLKQTPLHAVHRAAGARMVDFGGWDMPVHYGSQIDEHHAVRNDAGMFDVSHMRVVDLAGDGARAFLRDALANNVDKLKDSGRALYSCLLKPEGTVLDDLIVYFLREDFFRLVVNAGTADKDIAWFRSLIAQRAPGLVLTPRADLAMIAVQGPNARAKLWQALPGSEVVSATLKPFSAATMRSASGEMFIARTGYTGEDGFEVMLPATAAPSLWRELAAAGVRPCGLGARDTLRLEAGMNLYGQDMDETVTPLESGLAWTVDLKSPRDFVGKAALVAHPPARQLTGLLLLDKGGVLRSHQKVSTAHGDGETTSGTFSPTLGQSIALARLPAAVKVGEIVQVVIRDRALSARVVKPPFARNGKALVA